jgi:tyrosinase
MRLGFDPMFWLHHCNVDRLYAFWEYVYPDYWMGKGYYPENDATKPLINFVEGGGTYDIPENAPITESTGLTPFRKSETEYWTSSDVRFVPAGPDGSNAKSEHNLTSLATNPDMSWL